MKKTLGALFFPSLFLGSAALFSLAAPTGLLPGDAGSALVAKEGVRLPLADRQATERGDRAVAVFAGGCFWGVEGVFEHLRGVRSVQSGYAGGARADADYDKVSRGETDHAEAVRIVYDPSKVRYDQLLRIFFSVAHDPTQKNRQGPDVGRQYRSAIFPQTAEQRALAKAYMAQLEKARLHGGALATTLETGRFYPAEAYHQDFMKKNPRHGYVVRWDFPKLAAFERLYPGYWREKPSA